MESTRPGHLLFAGALEAGLGMPVLAPSLSSLFFSTHHRAGSLRS